MKILKKALLSFGILLCLANSTYATTNTAYVETPGTGFGKFVLLLVAFGLVGLVLFLGYKMDKTEASQRRKEKIIKNRNEKINDVNSEIYNTNTENNSKDSNVQEYNEETENIQEENEDEEDKVLEELASMIYPTLNDVVAQDEDVAEFDNDDVETELDEKDIIQKKLTTTDTMVISTQKQEEKKTMDSTMVFDTEPIKNNDIVKQVFFSNKSATIKGYDYEEDEELLDLKKTIAEANIKRYTRKKEKKQTNTKKYTRKKVVTKNDEVAKPKRGRPTKKEAEERAKRLQEKAAEYKPKRGRPPKNKTEKPKRGRPPKKSSNKKTSKSKK